MSRARRWPLTATPASSACPASAWRLPGRPTTNLLTGVANAYLDGVPMVALGGAAAFSSFERDDFQEYDQLAMAVPVTRWASRVTHSARMPEFFNLAYREAQGPKPGPTYLDLPGDTLYQQSDDETVWFPNTSTGQSRPGADPDEVKQAIELLANAERPIVLSGTGVFWSDASAELQEFVETTGIPFYTTPQGRGVIPEDHDLCFIAARSKAFREADVALVVGTRLNFVVGSGLPPRWAPDLNVIHIDTDPTEIGHNKEASVGMVADAKRALSALTDAAREANLGHPTDWIAELRESDDNRRQQSLELAHSSTVPIHPLRLADEVVQRMDRDAVVCVDGNATLAFARQYIPSFAEGGRLNPGPNGCMGVGLPFVLGAKAAAPERQVIGFVGDGSFLMNVQEIDTMVRHNLPGTIVISNNAGWTAGSNGHAWPAARLRAALRGHRCRPGRTRRARDQARRDRPRDRAGDGIGFAGGRQRRGRAARDAGPGPLRRLLGHPEPLDCASRSNDAGAGRMPRPCRGRCYYQVHPTKTRRDLFAV